MKRILERGYRNAVRYSKLKGESDASDSPKYAPQTRTAIHVYTIQDLDKKCKIFHRKMNFLLCNFSLIVGTNYFIKNSCWDS